MEFVLQPYLKVLVSIPAFFFLPGYVTTVAFERHEPERGLLEWIFANILLSIMIVSIPALILAEIGLFSWFNLLGLIIVYSGAVGTKMWRDGRSPAIQLPSWRTRHQSVAIGISLIAAVIFFRPFENIIVGRDPGVYVNTGINIARTGAILITDEFVAGLSPETRSDLLYSLSWAPPNTPDQFLLPGFYWLEDQQIIVPQFLHLYPTWIAIFYTLFGLKGALFTTPFFAWLALWAIYITAQELLNEKVGLIAMLLMTINPAQIWFARYANSEIMFQLIFWGATRQWIRYMRHQRLLDGATAGILFGMLFLIRIDAVLMLAPLILVLLPLYISEQKNRYLLNFIIPFGLTLSFAVFHAWSFSLPYTTLSFNLLVPLWVHRIPWRWWLIGGITLAGTALFLMIKSGRYIWQRSVRYRSLITRILALIVLLSCFYMYFISPLQPQIRTLGEQQWRTYGESNFVELGWYLSSMGLLLGTLGLSRLLAVKLNRKTTILLFAIITYSFFIKRSMVSLDHIFAIRRYVAVLIPGAVLCGSYMLICLGIHLRQQIWRNMLMAALLSFLSFTQIRTSWHLIVHHEFAGAVQQVQQLVKLFDPQPIIIFENQTLLGTFVAPPLKFLHDFETFYPHQELPSKSFQQVALTGLSNNRAVYFVSENNRAIISPGIDLVPAATGVFSVPFLEQAVDHFPTAIENYELPFRIYRVEQGTGKIIYRADYLLNQVGNLETDEEAIGKSARWARVATDAQGMLCYGPYAKFPPGQYRVEYRLKIAGQIASETPVAKIDVTINGSEIIAERLIAAEADADEHYKTYELQFHNSAKENLLEFRVYFMDRADIGVDQITLSIIEGT